MRHSEVAFCLLAASLSSKPACLRAGLPACRALVVMGCAVGMGSPMHACMCSPSVLACMARLPPAPPLCLNDWFPDPRSAGRAVAWPSRPRRPLGVCETQNSKERPQGGAPMCTGAQAKHSAHHKTPGGGAQGGSKPTSHSAAKGGQLALTPPPPPLGTLAHWHIGTLAPKLARVQVSSVSSALPDHPGGHKRRQAGRQRTNKQTPRSLVSVVSAKLAQPSSRSLKKGQLRASTTARCEASQFEARSTDRPKFWPASQPASQQARRQVGAGWLTGVVVVALGVGQHAGQVDHHAPGGCDTACDLYLLPI